MSEVAVPGRLSGAIPSPQSMLKEEIAPSGSVAENVTVTVWPTRAGFGETPPTVTVGGLSLTVSVVVPDPCPPLFVAVTVMVNVRVFALAVFA